MRNIADDAGAVLLDRKSKIVYHASGSGSPGPFATRTLRRIPVQKFIRPIAAAGSALVAVAAPTVAKASVVLAEQVPPWWASFMAFFH